MRAPNARRLRGDNIKTRSRALEIERQTFMTESSEYTHRENDCAMECYDGVNKGPLREARDPLRGRSYV